MISETAFFETRNSIEIQISGGFVNQSRAQTVISGAKPRAVMASN